MNLIAKAKQTLWKRYERERASQSANYKKKLNRLTDYWSDFIEIPELSLKIVLDIDATTKTPKRYRWLIRHRAFHVDTFYPSPDGNAYLMTNTSLNDRKKFLPLLKAIESAFGFHIYVNPHYENKNAQTFLNVLHKNKLANTKIPRNVKQLFGRADPTNNNANNPPLGLDLFSPEANAVIDALEKTTHANTAVPEYWVRYHGGLYASETMYYRFKVPKDVVIVINTYPGCSTFADKNRNWESKGHINAYSGKKIDRLREISYNYNYQNTMFVPYIPGDVMHDIHLTTGNESEEKMGLYRRRNTKEKFSPVDLTTSDIWLSDLVKKHGRGLYYVTSCNYVDKKYLNKAPLVKDLRNLALHAEKARRRKYKEDNYYSDLLINYERLFNKHLEKIKNGSSPSDGLSMQKELYRLSYKIHDIQVKDNHIEYMWKKHHQ